MGLGAQISLLLTRTLLDVPPGQLSAAPQLLTVASVIILAATCLGCARVTGASRSPLRVALYGLGLLAVGYLTAVTLEGTALVCTWALEAVALGQAQKCTNDPVARYAALVFLAAAAAHALVVEAPADALIGGISSVAPAAMALIAMAVAAPRLALLFEVGNPLRDALLAGAALSLGYLAAVSLDGPALVSAWVAEGVVLAELARRLHRLQLSAPLAAPGLIAAGTYAIATLAPPTALVVGVANLTAAGIALGAIAAGATAVGARGTLPRQHRVAALTAARPGRVIPGLSGHHHGLPAQRQRPDRRRARAQRPSARPGPAERAVGHHRAGRIDRGIAPRRRLAALRGIDPAAGDGGQGVHV